jgi:DegV family protein with EDD domain
MPNVAIVTDSIADLPPEVAEKLGITVVPIMVRFGQDLYRDGFDISPDEFYERLRGSKALPATSVPAPMAFADAYDKLAEKASEIVAICVTSRLSGTYQVALQAVPLMKKKARVEVLDSEWAVMAEGFITIAAAEAARAGASLGEVLDVAHRTMRRVDMWAAFDTLEYLQQASPETSLKVFAYPHLPFAHKPRHRHAHRPGAHRC